MSLPDARPEILDFLRNPAAIGPFGGRLRGGTGPFHLGPLGERIGIAWTFADAPMGRCLRASVRHAAAGTAEASTSLPG
jgi:hypothetical protein